MQKKTRRFLLFTLVMAVIATLTASIVFAAEQIVVDNRIELASLLSSNDDAHLILECNFKGEMPPFTVRGNKTLDLNGHNIQRYINRDDLLPADYMFEITNGATLTVTDSVGGGEVLFYSSELEKFMRELGMNPPVRDIFHVNGGTLIVNGGEFYCGNSQEFYMTHLFRWDSDIFDQFFRDREFVYYQSGGSVVTLKNGGTFIANGGIFHGRGFETAGYIYDNKGIQDAPYNGRVGQFVRHSTIKTAGEGNSAYINAGTFAGKGGADIFGIDTSKNTLKVRGGKFILHKFTNLFIYSYATDEDVEEDDRYEYYHKLTKGSINLPEDAWEGNANRMKVETNGLIYYDDEDKVQSALMELESSSSDSIISANFMPSAPQQLAANGEYTDEIFWNPMGDSVSVSCDIEPYYLKTETIPGYNIWYNWYIMKQGDSVTKAINATPSKSNTYSIANWGGHYAFPGWDASDTWITWCEIKENGPSGNLIYESKPLTLKLSYMPQHEIHLPGGEFKMTADYSKGGFSATVKIFPSPEQLMPKSGIKYAEKVSYRFVYRDNNGEQYDVTSDKNSLYISSIPKGESVINIYMRLEDKYGNVKEFSKAEWLVRIPEITVTGDAVNAGDGYHFTVKEGASFLLNAKFNEEYPGLDFTDIKGWYSAGLGDFYGTGPSFLPTQNGTYYFACWNKTKTNYVTSQNVIINFVDFSMTASRSAANIFFYDAPASGYDTRDSVLSIDLGSSFDGRDPYVLWRLVSYPTDAEKGIKYYALAGTQVSLLSFLDDTDNNVVPGTYYIQPEVTYTGNNNGKRLTVYGKTLNVGVYKFASNIDMTYNGRVINDSETIEAPETAFDLSYFVPQNASYDNVKVWWEIEQETPYGEDPIYEVEYSDRGGSYGTGYYYRKATITPVKPGRIKVTMKAGVNHTVGGYKGCTSQYDDSAIDFIRTLYINIPIRKVNINIAEPVIGGDIYDNYAFTVDENSPYSIYGYWENETPYSEFQKGMVPKAHIWITPSFGYVFDVKNIGDYENPIQVTDPQRFYFYINGNYTEPSELDSYSFNGEYYGNYEYLHNANSMDFEFTYSPGQLIPDDGEVLTSSNINFTVPTEGSVIDNDNREWHMAVIDSVSEGVIVYEDCIEEVCHNAYLDNDPFNDEETDVAQGATYEEGKYYRLAVKLETDGSNVFGKDFVPSINGAQAVYFFEYGRDDAWCYFYFTPKPLVEELVLYPYIPEGCAHPIDKYDLDVSGGGYVSDVYWFIDTNGNGIMDISEGEGDKGQFNADGSFIPGECYTMMTVLGIADEDEDGVGDYADLSDDVKVYVDDNSDMLEMTVEKIDATSLFACYTFEAASVPEYAFVSDTTEIHLDMVEGNWTSAIPVSFTVTSVGENEIDASQIQVMGETGYFNVEKNGNTFFVSPKEDADYLEPGEYYNSIVLYYEYEGIYVHNYFDAYLTVNEPSFDVRASAQKLEFEALEGYLSVKTQSVTLENLGNTLIDLTPDGMTVMCRSTDFNVVHSGDKITVVPVTGLKEGVYETTIIVRSNDYAAVQVYIDVVFNVGEKPIVYGDVDDDGLVTVSDAIKILQHIASGGSIQLGPKA